jgi:amino acid transporter
VAFGVTNQIAAGLFFVSTQIQQTVPGIGDVVPWLMLAGGGITLLTVLAYRYFFARGIIGAGGEYLMLRDSLGQRWAFLATLLALFGTTGSLGTLAYVATRFLSNACAAIEWNAMATLLAGAPGAIICGLVLLWGVWIVHVRGIKFAAVLTIASMVFVVAVALTVTGYGFATTPAQFGSALAAKLHVSLGTLLAQGRPQQVSILGNVATALPILFYSYLGLSAATQTGDEAVDARRSLSRGVLVAVVLVTIVYTVFAFAVYHAIPWQAIAALGKRGLTTYTTSTGLIGLVMPAWLSSLMNLFVAVIVIKTFLPIFLTQSRWIYAWGIDGAIPQWFAATHPRFGTPIAGLTAGALLASISLAESVELGYVFGVSLRVLSAMIVFFLIGASLLAVARERIAYVALGVSIMAFSAWFAIALIYGARSQPVLLQPAVQAVIVGIIGVLILRWAERRRAPAAAAADTARPGI